MTTINTARANLLAFITSPTSPQAAAIRSMLEAEGFSTPRLREILTDAVEVETAAAAVATVDVRAAIDAAVLAALDGINLREAIASLVEERVANADLDIEDLAKEVISDLAGDIDMEEVAKSAIEDNVDFAEVVRAVVDAEFTRSDIKHEIREAITERLSKVQVSVTV
jgi:hypothetical protein